MPPNSRNNVIVTSTLPENQKIRFSFEYYDDRQESKYCMSSWSQNQIKTALKRLKEISSKTFNEMRGKDKWVLHFGEVSWASTIEKNGFPFPEVNNLPPFHFALLSVNNQLTRVYGAYSQGVFYIVWFDLNHIIWPSALRHT